MTKKVAAPQQTTSSAISAVMAVPVAACSAHQLRVKRLHADALMPKYQTVGAACFDLHAVLDEPVQVSHQRPVTIRTGLAFEVPEGYVMMVYSRSGHGFTSDTRLANCVGVIDADYRGELRVKLASDARHNGLTIQPGDRIAQAMLVPVHQWSLVEVSDLSSTARGEGGYGSTGA